MIDPTPISPPANASTMTLTGDGVSASTVKMVNNPPTFTIYFDVTPSEEITAPFVAGTLSGWPGNVKPTSTISGTLSPGGTFSISTAGVLTINPDKAYGQGQHFTGTVSVASWYTPPPVTITGSFTCTNTEGDGSGTYTLTPSALSITGNINIRSTSTASQVIFTFDRALPITSPTGSGLLMYGEYERRGSMTYNSGRWYLPLNPSTSLGRGNNTISWSAYITRTD